MKVSIKKGGPCRRILTLDVPAEEMQAERAEVLRLYCKSASLPGFRRGHAPVALVEKKFARELREETQERAISKYYQQAIKEESVRVVQVIDVGEPEQKENGPMRFRVTVDIQPEFKLPKIEGIPIKAKRTETSEKEIDETIEQIRRRHASHEEVTDRAARETDLVQTSYEATVDGVPLEEKIPEAQGIGRGTGYWISCDDDSFLPGMGRALIGTQIGDIREIPVTFPDEFIVKELSGVRALYKVEVTAMRELKLPEFDEEFLRQLQVESVDELRKNIREYLEEGARTREIARQEHEICQYLLNKTKLDIPESDLQRQTRSVLMDLGRQRMMRGESSEQIKAQRDDLFKEAEQKGEEQVKLRYIMTAAADAQQIEVSDAEVSSEIVRLAIQRRQDATELRKQLEKEEQMDAVREQVRFGKTLDRLRELAKIK